MGKRTDLTAICRAEIKRHSGFEIISHPEIQPLRSGFFRKVNAAVSGDAPKDFIRVYEYGRCRKAHPDTWPAHKKRVSPEWRLDKP